jgi:hypothetical protein
LGLGLAIFEANSTKISRSPYHCHQMGADVRLCGPEIKGLNRL